MFLITIKLHRVSFETKGRQNLQKTADFVTESIVFYPLVPPSWISLVDRILLTHRRSLSVPANKATSWKIKLVN